ncbi:hypothetical protein [Alkaliphilus sp. B6464]|uniref:hypothetical protein n=1 Tax=Alkaliphilus sp. B6464 TaxID=2731219 RepID=UPI001BAC36F2|nr:hypothetical protein [Alkaliphilus sp. B6464]QUH18649.1 hypothetical protein HYG84_01145 [Alkaliphilus sp. B6464]
MRCRHFYYVVSDFKNNQIFSCGATFSEFMEFIENKPDNILLLNGCFGDGKYHSDIKFDYADKENMKDLIDDNVYSYGDFCWIDYKNMNTLDNITKLQLAELLYLKHKFEPLYDAHINWMSNDYLYMAHDDDYWTKIFIKNIQSYKNVVHGKILKALKGRKRHIEPIPDEIIDYIFINSENGILFDFENTYFWNHRTGVRIYELGRNYNYDKIFEVFKRKEHFTNTEAVLEYNNRNKKWSIYSDWKL